MKRKKFTVGKKNFIVEKKKQALIPMYDKRITCELAVKCGDADSIHFCINVDGHMWFDGRFIRERRDADRMHMFPHLLKKLGWPYDKAIFKKLEAFDQTCKESEANAKD